MKRPGPKKPAANRLPVRDAGATKLRILAAARVEFADHGYMGARVDRIARTARANKRLLYYYIGNKEALYLATLERAYADIRSAERELRLEELEPLAAIERLVRFTWAYFNANPSFMALLNTENLHRARHLVKSRQIPDMNSTVVAIVGRILAKGARQGVVRPGIDPLQLYISIASLCFFYLSNIHTLTVVFARDLKARPALDRRIEHIVALVLRGIAAAPGRGPRLDKKAAL
jgi:AcrR family transcriptional regulator